MYISVWIKQFHIPVNDDESSGGSSIMHSRIIILIVSCIGSNFTSSCYAYTSYLS